MMCFNLPQRMINIAKLACVISVVSVAFSSCLQKDVYDPANSGDKEEVTLDNYFDFATTKNIQLNIDYGKECPRAALIDTFCTLTVMCCCTSTCCCS